MMTKIKKLLLSKKGESLIESLVSIIIFSLLIVTITLTIATALRITAQATGDARLAQEAVNDIIAGRATGTPNEVTFSFTYTFTTPDEENGETTNRTSTATHDVNINTTQGRLAFAEQPED
jgi:Tfp pilus assembly protein PilV